MAESKTEKSAKTTKAAKTASTTKSSTLSTKEQKDFGERVMQMWAISIVVAFLLVLAVGVSSFYVREEAEIRRESYLANLEQLYQQEIQECGALASSFGDEGEEQEQLGETAEQCLKRINEEGRYATLVKKWGGEDLLITEF